MEKLMTILKDLEQGKISSDNAESQVLRLFNVGGSCTDDDLEEMKRLAHQGLPDDCVKGWDEVKFCDVRNSDGGQCKWCSNYR